MKARYIVSLAVLATIGLVGCGGGGGTTAPFIPFNPVIPVTPVTPATGTVFVADNDNGIIAMSDVLSTGALTLGATTAQPNGPTCLAVNPASTLLFCAEQNGGFIDSFTLNGGVPTASKVLNSNLNTRGMLVDPTGQFLYAQSDNNDINTFHIVDAAGTLNPIGSPVSTPSTNSTNGNLIEVTVSGNTFVVEADGLGINTFQITNNGTLALADGSQGNSGGSTGVASFVAGGTTFIVEALSSTVVVQVFSIDANGALHAGAHVLAANDIRSAPVVCQTATANGGTTPQTAYVVDDVNNLVAVPINASGVLQTPVLIASNLAFPDDSLIGDNTGTHLFAALSGFQDEGVQSIAVNSDGTVTVGTNVSTGGGDLEQMLFVP